MKRKRFSEEQIITALRELDAGTKAADLAPLDVELPIREEMWAYFPEFRKPTAALWDRRAFLRTEATTEATMDSTRLS